MCKWRKSPLRYVEEVTDNDVKQYVGWVIDNSKTKSRRTGENKFIRAKSWLTWAGRKVVTSKDAPVVPQKSSVHVLSDDALAKFFAACANDRNGSSTRLFFKPECETVSWFTSKKPTCIGTMASRISTLSRSRNTAGYPNGINFGRYSSPLIFTRHWIGQPQRAQ